MFGFEKEKSVIEVKFFEGKSEHPFAVSNVPIEQLPDTFAINTTLHLGGDDWRVLGAEPAEKIQFRKSGLLNLYLAKSEVTQVDPNELLYSLPTISDEIAQVENVDSLENIAVFQEDDWRQFEFINKSNESIINNELNQIKGIYENHRDGIGFTELYLRKEIDAPLDKNMLTLDLVKKYFDVEKTYAGVAFSSAAATIVGGFALSIKSGWLLWGQVDDSGKILVLNIGQMKEFNISAISEKIDAFTEKYDLYLIDWPRLFWCGPGKLKFSAYSE